MFCKANITARTKAVIWPGFYRIPLVREYIYKGSFMFYYHVFYKYTTHQKVVLTVHTSHKYY